MEMKTKYSKMSNSVNDDSWVLRDMKPEKRKRYCCGCFKSRCCCCCCCCFVPLMIILIVFVGVFFALFFGARAYCAHPKFFSEKVYASHQIDNIQISEKLTYTRGHVTITKNPDPTSSLVEITVKRVGMSKGDLKKIPYKIEQEGYTWSVKWEPGFAMFDCRRIDLRILVPASRRVTIRTLHDVDVHAYNATLDEGDFECRMGRVTVQNIHADRLKINYQTKALVEDCVFKHKVDIHTEGGQTIVRRTEVQRGELWTPTNKGGHTLLEDVTSPESILVFLSAGLLEIKGARTNMLKSDMIAGKTEISNVNLGGSGKLQSVTRMGAQLIRNVYGGNVTTESTAGLTKFEFTEPSHPYHADFSLRTRVGARSAKGPHVELTSAADANPLTGVIRVAGPMYHIDARADVGAIQLEEKA
eukprot:gnl/Trimastix_PCT/1615.p1 GENE.gnl/Trimastix_PCT/1615~~gnl/Trimastix_PCT/1615.p1  ORF type:complete len:415 (+),score=82.04 gnl/Trimastix_PCT/1615:92-1336(+)